MFKKAKVAIFAAMITVGVTTVFGGPLEVCLMGCAVASTANYIACAREYPPGPDRDLCEDAADLIEEGCVANCNSTY